MRQLVVLYSGGFDSTFLVSRVQHEFDRIHLTTHLVPGAVLNAQSLKNATRLRRRYGDKITHEYIDSRPLITKIRGGLLDVLVDNRRFDFYFSWCLGCKIGMHVGAIEYCLRHGIGHVADGNNRVQAISHAIEQREDFVEALQAMYRQFGITYLCPLYDAYPERELTPLQAVLAGAELIDHKQEATREFRELGFTTGPTLGHQHRAIQPMCFVALALNLTRFGLKLVRPERRTAACDYLQAKMGIIERHLASVRS